MADFKVFYAWQSDRPDNVCRSLVRKALDDAAEKLQDDLAIDDAPRVEVEIDQDTQGKAGSPPVAETILQKIRESDAFVADLTFTGCREGKPESPAPNPNVLIEYGYALHALGGKRVLAVFNEEFGDCGDLPFDLRHRRWPARYRTSGEGSDEPARKARRAAREQLAGNLAKAIKTIVREEGKREGDSGAADTGPLVEEFPLTDGLRRRNPDRQYSFPEGAKVLLCLRSTSHSPPLTNVRAQKTVQTSLKPLSSDRWNGTSFARVANGAAMAVLADDSEFSVHTASILLNDRSLYGIDCELVGPKTRAAVTDPFVPTGGVEKTFEEGLRNFLDVAKQQLDLALPLEVGVALEGVKGCRLGLNSNMGTGDYLGKILKDRIEDRFQIEGYDADPSELLKPFFKKIYDEAGLERP